MLWLVWINQAKWKKPVTKDHTCTDDFIYMEYPELTDPHTESRLTGTRAEERREGNDSVLTGTDFLSFQKKNIYLFGFAGS